MEERNLAFPTVHNNGTSKSELMGQLSKVYKALVHLNAALAAASPHMRDYYVKPGTWENAREQHETRMKAVAQMKDDIEVIVHKIYEQGN